MSHFNQKQDEYIQKMDADVSLLIGWIENILDPSFDLLNLKISIRALMQDIADFENKNGVSEKTKKSMAKFQTMLDISERLDKVAMQNSTFSLVVKHSQIELHNAKCKIIELEKDLEITRKEWK